MASAVSASPAAGIMRPRRNRANMRDARSMRRVIIKQGYLRKMPNTSRLGLSFKKPELRWFIFGVINSSYPYLEYFENEECIFNSAPLKTIFLDNCLYLTRNQRTSRHNYVFTLVMRDRSLSLVANNRDTMNEWCRAIEDKLHTLHIIDTVGGDNDYVKVPTHPRHSIATGMTVTETPPTPPAPSGSPNDHGSDAPEESIAAPPRPPGPIVYELLRQDARVAAGGGRHSENPYLSPRALAAQGAGLSELLPSQQINGAGAGGTESDAEHRQTRAEASSSNVAPLSVPASLPSVYSNSNRTGPPEPPPMPQPPQQQAVFTQSESPASAPVSAVSEEMYLCPVSGNGILRSAQQAAPVAVSDPSTSSNPRPVSRLPSYEESVTSDASGVTLSPASANSDSAFDMSLPAAGLPGYDSPPSYASDRVLEMNANMPLKSRQVRQLQEEMGSSAGIRVPLDKTQCAHALALIDAFGKVWVAGWNRRAYPLLQASFHIGDQLLSINEKPITSAKSATKILKSCADRVTAQLSLRRLPAAYICLVRRDDSQFESLGLQMVGSVNPSGIAAEHGLPVTATHPGSAGQCNWWITEVNHRSLNLFYRDGEIVRRLSGAGSHLSFVAQPAALIIEMKRRIKTMKYFKDYLIE